MAIPIGLAKVAGRLRSGRTGVGIQGNSSRSRSHAFSSPLRDLVEYSDNFVNSLHVRRRKKVAGR